ncbi:hypothetical protein JCM10207_005073 [Rhodosporidiobolus poonsookiae]
MCIVFWHVGEDDEPYSLIVASNRDEFLGRPTTSMGWHDWSTTSPTREPTADNRVLSGLDLTAGGTWLGVSLPPASDKTARPDRPALRFATLTNFTETLPPADRPSRGKLTREFLDLDLHPLSACSANPSSPDSAVHLDTYLRAVEAVKHEYAGFNLLVGEISTTSSSSSSSSSSSGAPAVRLAYISNRESDTKRARVLEPHLCAREGKRVRGLSNATLEVEEGEQEWPKVKSGAEAVERAVLRLSRRKAGAEREEELVKGLYEALSTPNPSPITHRTHLRHTVLVRPLLLDPSAPLPAIPPPLPPATPTRPSTPTTSLASPAVLPLEVTQGKREGEDGCHWYGTRVQTLVLVRRDGSVVVREREAYVLGKKGEEKGRPVWSGEERRFEFGI